MVKKIARILNGLFLILCAFTALFPMLHVLSVSFSSSRSVLAGEVFLWPVEFNIKAFTKHFETGLLFGGGLIPMFLLLKNLHILDTYWAIWLPGLISVYNLFVMKSFFEGLPSEVEESAI